MSKIIELFAYILSVIKLLLQYSDKGDPINQSLSLFFFSLLSDLEITLPLLPAVLICMQSCCARRSNKEYLFYLFQQPFYSAYLSFLFSTLLIIYPVILSVIVHISPYYVLSSLADWCKLSIIVLLYNNINKHINKRKKSFNLWK